MKTRSFIASLGLCLSGAHATDTTLVLSGGIVTPFVVASEVVTTPRWEIIPDYVFEPGYKLRSLEETEAFVRANKHLPEVPSARRIAAKGMDLTEMNLKLLKTVEELTLHVIDIDKRNRRLERLVEAKRAGEAK